MDQLFETHDKDQNGKLSWKEFSGQESKNEKAFKLMDADHNGRITKSVSQVSNNSLFSLGLIRSSREFAIT